MQAMKNSVAPTSSLARSTRELCEFLEDCCRLFRSPTDVAKHPNEEFLLIFDWHKAEIVLSSV